MSAIACLLVNPHANRGRAAHHIDAARAALARIGGVSVELTRHPGDEARIAQEAIDRNARALFVLGGDGTISGAARVLVNAKSPMPLAVLAAGTGNDFAKSLHAPVHDFHAMAALVADNAIRTIDAGRVDDVVFINSAGFGFDVEVLRRTLRPGFLRGNAVYIGAALHQLFRYRAFHARVESTAQHREGRWLMLVFANGGWFGGTFHIAPDASITDGELDAVAVTDVSQWRRARLFAAAPRGRHVHHAGVEVSRASSFALHFPEAPYYQVDGELRLAASAHVAIASMPNALHVAAP